MTRHPRNRRLSTCGGGDVVAGGRAGGGLILGHLFKKSPRREKNADAIKQNHQQGQEREQLIMAEVN